MYIEEEEPALEGAVGFSSQGTSTPKDPEIQERGKSQGSRPSELSTIAELSEIEIKVEGKNS